MRNSRIRWTDATWNFYSGCVEVSPGCDNCYARELAERMRGSRAFPNGFDLTFRPHKIDEPRRIREPSRIFVNSMSDYFHHEIPDEHVAAGLDVMLDVDRHVYQILTKRPDRMRRYMFEWLREKGLSRVPDHIWLGVSIESNAQEWRAQRLACIPAVRFISAEPLLGPLDRVILSSIDWLIVGGESGPRYRPMDDQWARDLRDRCAEAGVAFYFKQHAARRSETGQLLDGVRHEEYPPEIEHLQRGADAETTRRPRAETPSPQAPLF